MNTTSTLLLIDDDIDLCESIKKLLVQHGFHVLLAHNSQNIESLIKENNIDLVLLDIILPGSKDGIALCKLIRELTTAPIIMLTGIEADIEKIVSLEVGADSYVTKPFNSRVLLAQINSCLRRQSKVEESRVLPDTSALVNMEYQILQFLDWQLNVTAHSLLSPLNEIITLTSAEFSLLHGLLQYPQCVLSRDQLLDFIKTDSEAFDRSIDILISRLRMKIEKNPKNPQLIKTVRNAGYLLACCVKKRTIDSRNWQALTC
jgi:two-component system OmpR family response regulator